MPQPAPEIYSTLPTLYTSQPALGIPTHQVLCGHPPKLLRCGARHPQRRLAATCSHCPTAPFLAMAPEAMKAMRPMKVMQAAKATDAPGLAVRLSAAALKKKSAAPATTSNSLYSYLHVTVFSSCTSTKICFAVHSLMIGLHAQHCNGVSLTHRHIVSATSVQCCTCRLMVNERQTNHMVVHVHEVHNVTYN
jgi:hypothetical protein